MRTFTLLTASFLVGCLADPLEMTDVATGSVGEVPGIAVEVDFVGYQRFEPGTIELLERAFASVGYELTVEPSDELEPVDRVDYGAASPMIRGYYEGHFDHRGEPGWHYLLMADAIGNGNRGWGMLGGDVLLISSDPVAAHPGREAEAQANIILHELGHNLGLVHEGFEPELSAGTHSKATCATADRAPAPDVPVVFYSPVCAEHLQLESRPLVPRAPFTPPGT